MRVQLWMWFLLAGCSGRDASTTPAAESGPDSEAETGANPCPSEYQCRDGACCATGESCRAGVCIPVCTEGTECGGTCCVGDEICVADGCVVPEASCRAHLECEKTKQCSPSVQKCIDVPSGSTCGEARPAEIFNPKEIWDVNLGGVFAAPVVADLDGDGLPEVISLFVNTAENVRAMSGKTGAELWRCCELPGFYALVGATPAVADVDGDGDVEIFVVMTAPVDLKGYLVAIDHEGNFLWASAEPGFSSVNRGVSLADLDGDGDGEIVSSFQILDHMGNRLATLTGGDLLPVVVDIDSDGVLEILKSDRAFDAMGNLLWERSLFEGDTATAPGFFVGPDGEFEERKPQLFVADGNQVAVLDAATGDPVLGPVVWEDGSGKSIGEPAVADFDGDGRAEVGVVGDHDVVLFDFGLPEPHVRWRFRIEDFTAPTAALTAYDPDGDGAYEVIVTDECHVKMISGLTGNLLWYTGNTSGTGFEYPTVANIDGLPGAELLIVSNFPQLMADGTIDCNLRGLPGPDPRLGLRVFKAPEAARWPDTRAIWNQHAYHVDNVLDDGSLPTPEPAAWLTHSTYRVNPAFPPEGPVYAADLLVEDFTVEDLVCPQGIELAVKLRNVGGREASASTPVSFYAGHPEGVHEVVATESLGRVLYPQSSMWVAVNVDWRPFAAHDSAFVVIDDDGRGRGVEPECDEENNQSGVLPVECFIE